MADYNYVNPFAGLPDPATFNVPGFGATGTTSMLSAQREDAVKPFLDTLMKGQALTLQQHKQETAEFMSPEGKEARRLKRLKDSAEYDEFIKTSPFRVELKKWEVDVAPDLAKFTKADALAKARDINTAQHSKSLNHLAQAFYTMKDMTEAQRKEAWAGHVGSFEQGNPDYKVPDNMRTYSPENFEKIRHAALIQMYTPKAIEERALEEMKAKSAQAVAQTHVGGQVAAANIAAAASTTGHELAYGTKTEQIAAQREKNALTYVTQRQNSPEYMQASMADESTPQSADAKKARMESLDTRYRTSAERLTGHKFGDTSTQNRTPINPTTSKPYTMIDLKKLYPNKTDVEIRQAFKERFGMEPQ